VYYKILMAFCVLQNSHAFRSVYYKILMAFCVLQNSPAWFLGVFLVREFCNLMVLNNLHGRDPDVHELKYQ